MDGHTKQLMNEKRFVINGLEIDPVIFTQPFVDFCDISKCGGECCNSGVWADITEVDTIKQNTDLVLKYMDETQERDTSKWFEKEIVDDVDFASGKCIGTEAYDDHCVFQMKNGYCVLQSAAMQEGLHKWALKPKFCVLYPIVISDGVLTYDDDHAEELHYCGLNCHQNHVKTVFEACGEEIEYAVGVEGFKILKEHYEANKEKYRAEYERIHNAGLIQIALPAQEK